MLQSTSWISLLLTARHGCCCSGTVLNSFLVSVQQLIPSSCSNGLKSHIYLCHLVFVCCCFVCFLARLISSTLMQPFTLLVLLTIFPSFILSSLHCIVDLHESACPLIFLLTVLSLSSLPLWMRAPQCAEKWPRGVLFCKEL